MKKLIIISLLAPIVALATQSGPVHVAVPPYPVAGAACVPGRVQLQSDNGRGWCCVASKWVACAQDQSAAAVTATSGPTKTLADWTASGPVRADGATVTATGGTVAQSLRDWMKDVDAALPLATAVKATSHPGGGLARLHGLINDDFVQYPRLLLVGDSITWGLTATGNAPTDPRTGQLSDPRDVLTSASWVNLVRSHLAAKLGPAGTTAMTATATPGEGYVEWDVGLFFSMAGFQHKFASGAVATPTYNPDTGRIFGTSLQLNGYADNLGVEFDFRGDSFTIVYSQQPGHGDYQLIIDGVSQGQFTTAGTATYRVERAHSFTAGQHHVRINFPYSTFATTTQIEGIKFKKRLYVKNDGIIGSDTGGWLPGAGLLNASVTAATDVVLVQLGTNDRPGLTTGRAPWVPARTYSNLRSIAAWIKGQGKTPVLMAASAISGADSYFAYGQRQVAQAIERAARDEAIDYVDNYVITKSAERRGFTYLADGLHPNDYGHRLMAANVIGALERAELYQPGGQPEGRLSATFSVTALARGSSVVLPDFSVPGAQVGDNVRVSLPYSGTATTRAEGVILTGRVVAPSTVRVTCSSMSVDWATLDLSNYPISIVTTRP